MTLPPEIAAALARGAQVVTSNQRAARTLRRAFDEDRRAAGEVRWQPPEILAFESWAAGQWHRLMLRGKVTRILLNPAQELAVWRGIVAADGVPRTAVDALAEMAAEAWSRLLRHSGRARLGSVGVSTDTKAFQRWARTFAARCQREQWVTAAELPGELVAAEIDAADLMLVGFDTPPPAYTSLFSALAKVETFVPRVEARVELATCADEASEVRAAARWARAMLELEPASRIAVVVPGLAERKAAIDRVFREVLAPELEEIGATHAAPYEFSYGQPLSETALVAVALDLLRWPRRALSVESASALLLSPYFGDPAHSGTATFDAFELRQAKVLRPEFTLEQMVELVERSKRHARLETLLKRLHGLRRAAHAEQANTAGTQRPYADWADAFRAMLHEAGWAAGAEDSIAFQTRERWESTLDELAMLDFEGTHVSAATALEVLEQLAASALFAPESNDAPVQVIGPLEAAGSTFDGLWVIGAGEQTWPPQSSTTPLLPWHLQVELAMPGADAARDRSAALTLTERLAGSATTVVFSYAATRGDGSHQRPSALLDGLTLSEHEPVAEPARDVFVLEEVTDEMPPPFFSERAARGGARVLELQAACPFRAFAEFRLHATAIDTRDPGQDPRERGNDVHNVMEWFWNEARDQPTLRQMTAQARAALLDACVAEALERTSHAAMTPWDGAYLALQRQRLNQLLTPWIDFEMTRPAFAVQQREEKLQARVGELHLSLRADRVDETEGGFLIVDYKTGAAAPADWLGERPDAPQLPLYAIQTDAEQLGGVAFALLRAGRDLGLKGFATGPEVIDKGTKTELPLSAQVDAWRRVLTALAESFVAGDARVDPKSYPKTCARCDQRLLCRLNPAAAEPDEEEESEAYG